MPKFKITVLRTMANHDLADRYCVPGAAVPCPAFTEGQEFVLEYGRQPEGFCGWAWNDLHRTCAVLLFGGTFDGWNKLIRCCTDGIRPVVFEVARIDD